MNHSNQPLSRRGFLRLASLSMGGLALRAWGSLSPLEDFPKSERLGRVCVGKVELKARPDEESPTVGVLYEDAVVPWLREVVGNRPYYINQRWVETPEGFIYAPYLQPVRNLPNQPVKDLVSTSLGQGMWAEVTIPYVDVLLDNPPARSPWLKEFLNPRLYYSQVFWIDQVKNDEQGQAWYRVNERFGYGDLFWARAEAFRPLSPEEILPISPEVEEKRLVVDVTHQTLTCFEGKTEVYFCRVSTGARFDAYGNPVDKWATPVGAFPIWRKLLSLHMTGGTTGGGWDISGITWTSLFVGSGVAVHGTYWHNDYGAPRSHGCVNARPEDAKWIFRWVLPQVNYDPGDVTVSMPGGTIVEVVEL